MEIIKKKLRRIFKRASHNPKGLDSYYTKDAFRDKKFEIGEFTYGTPRVIFEMKTTNLTIGKFCSIAENVTIFLGGNHRTDFITTFPFNTLGTNDFQEFKYITGHPATKGSVVIGNDVWIGMNSVILSGVNIGDGAVVAANSVITKNIGPYEIWGGNPAKFIKKRFTNQQVEKLLIMKWWNWDISKIKDNIQYLMNADIEKFLNQNS